MSAMKPATQQNTPVTDNPLSYLGYRFPPDVISYAGWLYYRLPLSLRVVEELLAARGIALTHETVRRWAVEFGQGIAGASSPPPSRGATSGTSMKWGSPSTARSTRCGARWPARCGARRTGTDPPRQACGQPPHA